jgi:hypothetical protein
MGMNPVPVPDGICAQRQGPLGADAAFALSGRNDAFPMS